jgi:hypothetical protein
MFATRYFDNRAFAPRYFAKVGFTFVLLETLSPLTAGSHARALVGATHARAVTAGTHPRSVTGATHARTVTGPTHPRTLTS